jgi:hypothetical protein
VKNVDPLIGAIKYAGLNNRFCKKVRARRRFLAICDSGFARIVILWKPGFGRGARWPSHGTIGRRTFCVRRWRAGYNFSLLLRWLAAFLRALIAALLNTRAPAHIA